MEERTLRQLREDIDNYVKRYGEEVLDYPVFLEQCDEKDKEYKRTKQGWDIVKVPDYPTDDEEFWWEYFEMAGGMGISTTEKKIYISVNY